MTLALAFLAGCNWIPKEALDADRDGVERGLDCDDEDATVGEPGPVFIDHDGDGFGDTTASRNACTVEDGEVAIGGDCDDDDDAVHPDAIEICNGRDDDCDDQVDDADDVDGDTTSLWLPDADGDGFPVSDLSSAISACEAPDGYAAPTSAPDCDDRAEDADGDGTPDGFLVNPAAQELCGDLIDNDCNGEVDEFGFDDAAFYADADGDDWPDDFTLVQRCNDGDDAFVSADGFDASVDPVDCDPSDAARYPGAPETPYDGIDQDCAGDDDFDVDGDGFTPGAFASASPLPSGDCNDFAAAINPDAIEVPYDGVDDNCVPEDDDDVDGDGFAATVVGGTDCDDTRADVFPAAVDDPYDGIDSNCDSMDDFDADGDGFAATGTAGTNPTDCNDADPNVFPGAPETFYDGIDADCQADSDFDQDGDGFVPAAFADVHGSSLGVGDCDDASPSVHPDASEACNGVDDDCDGSIDNPPAFDTSALTALVDADGDGFPSTTGVQVCAFSAGLIDPSAGVPTDCDDTDASTFPGASEVLGDGIDQDCTGNDELLCFQDLDADGYGDGVILVDGPDCGPHATTDGDCNDSDGTVSPGHVDWCDAVDQDCDGDPIGVDAIFFDDGSAAPLTNATLDLTGVTEISFCGGEWSIALMPSDHGIHTLKAYLPTELETSIIGTTRATMNIEGVTLVGQTTIDIEGEPHLQLSDITVVSTHSGGLVRQQGGSLEIAALSASDRVTTEPMFELVDVQGIVSDSTFHAIAGPSLFGQTGGVLELHRVGVSESETTAVIDSSDATLRVFDSTFEAASGRAVAATGGTVAIDAAHFQDFAADRGGALWFDESTAVISNASFVANSSFEGGAIAASGGSLTVQASQFTANGASRGAGLWLGGIGIASISGSTFEFNSALEGAGLFATDETAVLLNGSTFQDNWADLGAGLLSVDQAGVLMQDCLFVGNMADEDGGAIGLLSTTLNSVRFSEFTDNEALGRGGAAILAAGVSQIQDTVFSANRSTSGGAVFSGLRSTLHVARSTFDDNASGKGGAIYLYDGSVLASTLSRNQAVAGGAIFMPEACSGTTPGEVFIDADFFDNQAFGAGGAISHHTYWLIADACAPSLGPPALSVTGFFEGNTAEAGGAVASVWGFDLSLSTFRMNSAGVHGGAIWGNYRPPSPTGGSIGCPAVGTAFDGNSAPRGGAVFLDGEGRTLCSQGFTNNSSLEGAAVYSVGSLRGDVAFDNNTGSSDVVVGTNGAVDFRVSGGTPTIDVPGFPDTCTSAGPDILCTDAAGCTSCP